MKEKDRLFYENRIKSFREKRNEYIQYKIILEKILERIARHCSSNFIIQVRVKTISSFAEKIQRQKYYKKSVEEIDDLCGGRIILPSMDEVKKVCKLIEDNFVINWKNSEDKLEEMKVSEFGYLSTHYSVHLMPDSPFYDGLKIPKMFYWLKAEIQIRTFLQHVWATIYHDIGYKGRFEIPKKWNREFYRLAAILENADESFSQIQRALLEYESNYGGYMTEKQINEEIEKLEIVYAADPENIDIAHRIAKMAISIGKWEKAISMLQKFIDSKNAPILRDLGIAMWKNYPKDSKEFQKGREYLEEAIRLDPTDSDALASLGGLWKDIDEDKARFYYKKAFEINPTDQYSLGNYLIYEIRKQENLDPIFLSRTLIRDAIKKCNNQIEVEINIPWAFFDIGLFHLFLGEIQESLDNYLMGIKFSTDDWMIFTTLKTLDLLNIVNNQLPGIDIVRNLLLLGLAFLFENKEVSTLLKRNYDVKESKLCEPIVILTGSIPSYMEAKVEEYKGNLIQAFKNFQGTIISGGTTAGVSGFAGDLQEHYPTSIKTIGYVPKSIPIHVRINSRYTNIRRTSGSDFSVRETIQYWLDIWVSNIDSNKVKLFGIAGGKICAFEYRLALVLGAKVGILENSGGEASILIKDPKLLKLKKGKENQLKILKNNVKDIETFLLK